MEREIWRIGKVMKGNRPEQNTHLAHGKEPCFSGPGATLCAEYRLVQRDIMDFVNQRQRKAVG